MTTLREFYALLDEWAWKWREIAKCARRLEKKEKGEKQK